MQSLSVHSLAVASRAELAPSGGVSFRVRPGEILALCGEHGAGKSALLAAVAGVPLWEPGSVRVLGGDVRFQGRSVLGRREEAIGFVPQNSGDCLPPSGNLRRYFRDIGTFLEAPLSPKKPFERMARAERSLAAIAIAASRRPKVLVVDAPEGEAVALDFLRNLVGAGVVGAVLYGTCDIFAVREFASRIMVLYADTIVELRPTEKLFAHPLHPYTQHWLGADEKPLRQDPAQARGARRMGGCPYFPDCALHLRSAQRNACQSELPPHCFIDSGEVACQLYSNSN
jgi:ABC-type dipeptide/oligopeptide/nickel transport system ATPase component